MRAIPSAISILALVALTSCQKPLTAPRQAEVCWRLGEGLNGKEEFKPFATGVETLENCAVQLEGARLANGQAMVGGFQGRVIYVTDEDITVAKDGRSQRYRIFTPQQRAKIDAGFRQLKARELQTR